MKYKVAVYINNLFMYVEQGLYDTGIEEFYLLM